MTDTRHPDLTLDGLAARVVPREVPASDRDVNFAQRSMTTDELLEAEAFRLVGTIDRFQRIGIGLHHLYGPALNAPVIEATDEAYNAAYQLLGYVTWHAERLCRRADAAERRFHEETKRTEAGHAVVDAAIVLLDQVTKRAKKDRAPTDAEVALLATCLAFRGDPCTPCEEVR